MAEKKVLFHHDNAPSLSSRASQQKLTELRFQMLPHPPYSPDLASSDHHLFPKFKTFLARQKFGSNKEVIQEVNAYFKALEKTHFREGITNVEKRWSKWVELRLCQKIKYVAKLKLSSLISKLYIVVIYCKLYIICVSI